FGICLGMVLLVIEEHQRAETSLREISGRRRQLAERDAAFLAEVSERRRVEQVPTENEERYRPLVEHSKDLLCTHDLVGLLLSINPTPARVLGYDVDELLQIPMPQLLAPKFRDRFDAYIKRIREKGEAFGLMRVLTRTGEERVWKYHNTLYTEGVAS